MCSAAGLTVPTDAEYKIAFGKSTLSTSYPHFFNYTLDNVSANVYNTISNAYAALPVNQIFSLSYDRWQTGHTVSNTDKDYRPTHGNGTSTYIGSFEYFFPNSSAPAGDGSVYATLGSGNALRRISLSTTSNGNTFDLSGKKYEIRVNFALDETASSKAGDIVRLYRGDNRWKLVYSNSSGELEAHKKALYDKDGNKLSFVTTVTNGVPASVTDLRVVVDEANGTYSIYVNGEPAYYKNGNHFDPFVDFPLNEALTVTDNNAIVCDCLRLFASFGSNVAVLKDVSVTLIRDSEIEYIGSQSRDADHGAEEGTFDLRFAFGVDDIYQTGFFRVDAYENGNFTGTEDVSLLTVYKSLNAAGGDLYAYRCPEGEYLAAFKITGIESATEDTNYTFVITPVINGEDQETTTVAYNGLGQVAEPKLTPDEPGTDTPDTPEFPETFTPTVRFVVTSDIHISTANGKTAGHFKTLMNQINAYVATEAEAGGYGALDAVVIAGDLTGEGSDSAGDKTTHVGGTHEEFVLLKGIFDETIPEGTELILTMGNHDYGNVAITGMTDEEINASIKSFRDDFETVFETKAAQMVNINGFYFVTVDVDAAEGKTGHEYSQASVAALDAQLKEATAAVGSNMPIFVFQHVGNLGTALGTSEDAGSSNYSTALYDTQKQYSNLIVFSGHTHLALNDECSIHQKDFTSINTGALAGISQAKVNGTKIYMNQVKYPQAVYVVEADEFGRVRVRMWNSLDQNGFYGETWMIDSYNKDEFKYTEDRYSNEDIFFAEDAEVTVKSVTETSVTIEFPHVPEESLTARA